jgi:hypothetical protein
VIRVGVLEARKDVSEVRVLMKQGVSGASTGMASIGKDKGCKSGVGDVALLVKRFLSTDCASADSEAPMQQNRLLVWLYWSKCTPNLSPGPQQIRMTPTLYYFNAGTKYRRV